MARHYSSERRPSRSREREGGMISNRKEARMHSRGGSMHENPEERSKHQFDEFNDQNYADRGNERAVYRRFRTMGNEIYAGMEPRRRQEMEDAGMIHEDHNAIANLPQNVMIQAYPETGPYMPEGLEDSIRGIDHQMDYDDEQRRAHFYPKKV